MFWLARQKCVLDVFQRNELGRWELVTYGDGDLVGNEKCEFNGAHSANL